MPISQQQEIDVGSGELPLGVRAAIAELAVAHDYACDAQCEPWQFAVEISRLTDLGLTGSDLRWLVEKRYVAHSREVTQPDDVDRKFVPCGNTAFTSDSRFLLTDTGLVLTDDERAAPTLIRFRGRTATAAAEVGIPRWNRVDRTLILGGRIVKRFMRPSPNQQIVLTAFEEEGWPERIDDPLPPSNEVDPKRRLHDTIKWLNRNQEVQLLSFSGDGTGEGIRWQTSAVAGLAGASKARRQLRAAA